MVLSNKEKEYLTALKDRCKINIDYATIDITFAPEHNSEITEVPQNHHALLLLKKDKNRLKSILKADGKKGLQIANKLLSKVCFSSEVKVLSLEDVANQCEQDKKEFNIKTNNSDKIILI